LAVFVPVFVRSHDLMLSLGRAAPLLFIGMCTFIANDLEDVERDRINHPDRPLPSGRLSQAVAASMYFACLAAALFSARYFVEPLLAFWYYTLVALSVSYVHVVDRLPNLKALYVALAISLPIVIVAKFYPNELQLYRVAAAVFLFTLGRELCMDIEDRAGDPRAFLHGIAAEHVATFAFLVQVVGLLVLPVDLRNWDSALEVLVLTILLVASGVYWFRLARRKRAIRLMKLQYFVGLYSLV
jgi:geranylgeranylglycerol-phosphate geranylgeranyltransferase